MASQQASTTMGTYADCLTEELAKNTLTKTVMCSLLESSERKLTNVKHKNDVLQNRINIRDNCNTLSLINFSNSFQNKKTAFFVLYIS